MKRLALLALRLGVLSLGAVVAACSSNAKSTTAPKSAPPVAAIPRGAVMHDVSLNSAHWKLTPHFHQKTGSKSSPSYEYIGTGAPNGNDVVTATMPVQPGRIYVFSAWANPSNLVVGDFDLLIDTHDGSATYAMKFSGGGPPGRFSTAPWLAPPGVTRVMLVMQLVSATISKGEAFNFADPRLSDAVSTTSTKS